MGSKRGARYFELFLEAAEQWHDQDALCDGEASWTYSDLLERVLKRQRELGRSIYESDLVAIVASSYSEAVVDMLAIWSLGAAVILVSAEHNDQAVPARIKSCRPTVTVGHATVVRHDGSSIRSLDGSDEPPFMLFATSGTTGLPKIVAHSERSLLAGFAAVRSLQGEEPSNGFIRIADSRLGLRFLSFASPNLISGFTVCQRALLCGDYLVLMSRPSAREILDVVEDKQITNLMLSPLLAQQVARELRQHSRSLGCLITIGIGGGLVAPGVVSSLEDVSGCTVLVGYGMTETAGPIFMHRPESELAVRSAGVGPPLPGVEFQVLYDSDDSAGGELAVRCPSLFMGYWDGFKLSAKCDTDGWYRTGDQVEARSGTLQVVGRRDGVIIRGGMRIDPKKIEEVLLSHPDVRTAVVSGRASRIPGETDVIATISIHTKATAGDVERNLRDWCIARLPAREVPRRIVVSHSVKIDPSSGW